MVMNIPEEFLACAIAAVLHMERTQPYKMLPSPKELLATTHKTTV
jgi:hypothetical protein